MLRQWQRQETDEGAVPLILFLCAVDDDPVECVARYILAPS